MSGASAHSPLAVVTGGASGIGFALAEAFAAKGSRILIADIDADALSAAAERVSAAGVEAHTAVVDLRNKDSVVALVDRAQQLGPIGAVCLNAGVTSSGTTVWNTDAEVLDFMLAVNLRGLFTSIGEFMPALIAQGSPADVVITASMAGMVASPYSAAYAASKAGAIALAKALRREVEGEAPFINVALLNPGMVQTNLIRTSAARLPQSAGMSEEFVQGGHAALNELGVTPAEAAAWALNALSRKQFWAFPPGDDMFSGLLSEELEETRSALE